MQINDYQTWTITTAVYPGAGEHSLPEGMYLTLGLASEAGEVAGKLKKFIRGDKPDPEGFLSELSDVLWYLARLCDNIGITMEDLADYNYKKLEQRKATNTIKGNGESVESRIITDNT
jgi:NTP pyrophosphatase (non-canonical NTP hydrolase)